MVGCASTDNHSPAVMQAQQMLQRANAAVDADKAAHSPGCVAVDQKRVDRAEIALAQVSAAPSPGTPSLSLLV